MSKKKITIIFSGMLLFSDFLVIVVSFLFSYWFRFYSGIFTTPLGTPSLEAYLFPIVALAVLSVVIMNYFGLYKGNFSLKFINQFFVIFRCLSLTMLIILAATFFYREKSYSRSLIMFTWVILILFFSLSRYIWHLVYLKIILLRNKKKIIIVGRSENIQKIMPYFKKTNFYQKIVGVITPFSKDSKENGVFYPVLGKLSEFSTILRNYRPDEIILADLELPRKKLIRLILECEKNMVKFKVAADLLDIMVRQFELENISGLTLVKFKESPLNLAYNRFAKRLMDIIFSALGLVILAPVFLIVAIIVKIDSRGAVFFKQRRIGEDGKEFFIYKFRTMKEGAEKDTGPIFASPQDSRCTKIGQFLRSYNIDELPQLVNVLIGQMSLVGPRPERPYFVNQFKENIPRYMSRHHIKSGITGWAQVNGLRQGTPIEERVKYDLYYIENWSIIFDLKIIFMSFFALKNAY